MVARFLLILAAAGALLASPVAAQTVQLQLDERIGDNAEILSPAFEEEMKPRLAAIDSEIGVTVMLVTLPTIGQAESSKVAQKIGGLAEGTGKVKGDWVVLLLAPVEREFSAAIKSATGGDAIKELTDPEKRELLEDIANEFAPAVTPYFKDDRWEDGMRAGVEAIERLLGITDAPQTPSGPKDTQS
ncbi:MAG: TPM domain-containing protein [Pseudomonadota bacterium]